MAEAQIFDVILTPRERWVLWQLTRHKDFKTKGRVSERKHFRTCVALGLAPISDVAKTQANPIAINRKAVHDKPSRFTLTVEHVEHVLSWADLEKPGDMSETYNGVAERLEEAQAGKAAPIAEDVPVYDPTTENWEPQQAIDPGEIKCGACGQTAAPIELCGSCRAELPTIAEAP